MRDLNRAEEFYADPTPRFTAFVGVVGARLIFGTSDGYNEAIRMGAYRVAAWLNKENPHRANDTTRFENWEVQAEWRRHLIFDPELYELSGLGVLPI
jgi:hypothetical protein